VNEVGVGGVGGVGSYGGGGWWRLDRGWRRRRPDFACAAPPSTFFYLPASLSGPRQAKLDCFHPRDPRPHISWTTSCRVYLPSALLLLSEAFTSFYLLTTRSHSLAHFGPYFIESKMPGRGKRQVYILFMFAPANELWQVLQATRISFALR
jgi:hypothetical protein